MRNGVRCVGSAAVRVAQAQYFLSFSLCNHVSSLPHPYFKFLHHIC
jgi:hypothetical protein